MIVELDDDVLDKVFVDSLLDTYRRITKDTANIFSFEQDVEAERRLELLTSLEVVHDWYSATPLQQRLKSEEALETLHAIDQELGLYESK